MKITRNTSLKDFNTFGIDASANNFVSVENLEELQLVLKQNYAEELLVLGGGSNILLTRDFDGTVLHINLKGKKVLQETEEEALVEVNAGENWHEFVLWSVEQGFGGIENLSLIPGNIGTAPIQNIGAYGVEIKDTFVSCKAINVQTLEIREFQAEECEFGYRNSIFKNQAKGNFIIFNVTFKFRKKDHQIHSNYGAINEALKDMGITTPGIKDISNAVIKIRQAKLPDPKVLGNSGSFFKNPVISTSHFENIRKKYPKMPHYPISEDEVKIPAGWLIDRAGFKGYREGDAGVHKNQALVLVNYGAATGNEILSLARKIQQKIFSTFEIELQPEVNII